MRALGGAAAALAGMLVLVLAAVPVNSLAHRQPSEVRAPRTTAGATTGNGTAGAISNHLPGLEAGESDSSNGIDCRFPDTDQARRVVARIIAAGPGIIAAGPGLVAFAVHDDQTGTTCSRNGEQHFQAASVIKVATVAARLWQAETYGFELSEEERFWAELAITVSDNDAQQYLWQLVGGATGIAGFFAAAGMDHTVPSYEDDDWGITAITADDELMLIRQLADHSLLTPEHSEYLLHLMRHVDSEQVWGVNAGAPAGAEVALKNGWLDDPVEPTYGQPDAVVWTCNSIGYIRAPEASYSLAVLSEGHASDVDGREVVSAVSALVAAALLGS